MILNLSTQNYSVLGTTKRTQTSHLVTLFLGVTKKFGGSVLKEFGIRVVLDKPLNKDGYLVCAGGQKLIFVSSKITNEHRQSFIAAHEIGHFLLHSGQLYGCSNISETKALIINSCDQESEANAFASELLLPKESLGQADTFRLREARQRVRQDCQPVRR